MNSKKNTTSNDSSIRMHEFHVSGCKVSLRASKSFISIVRSKLIHGEAFAGIEDIDEVGNGWYHLVPSGVSSTGSNRTKVDRELIAAFAGKDIQELVCELLSNEGKADTFQTKNVGRNRVVIQLTGKASSAQRPDIHQRAKPVAQGKLLRFQEKYNKGQLLKKN